jgi:hypothetical protein
MTNYSAHHRKKFEDLKKQVEDGGTRVKLVADGVLKDFAGMNSEAARILHFSMPDNEIWISSALSWPVRYYTLVHEIHERDRMIRGVPYWEAHSEALRVEGGQ